jgi:hypothetical protein
MKLFGILRHINVFNVHLIHSSINKYGCGNLMWLNKNFRVSDVKETNLHATFFLPQVILQQ